MPADPYATLGVAKSATADDIRRAYRKLAKQNHPDLHPGNKPAEERFKTINMANDLLSDPDKRARFDRGEIDGAGDPRYQPPPSYAGQAQGPRGFKYGGPAGEEVDPSEYESIFSEFLNPGAGRRRQPGPRRGADRSYTLTVDFLDAVNGAVQRLTLPGGGAMEVRIPAGIEDGQTLRLRDKGEPSANGGATGDALIEISIRPHPLFRREGADITVELPITLSEAVLGAKVPVPTATGSVTLSIPPNSATGARLRLRGRGVPARNGAPAGDQYVTLKIVLDPNDAALSTFLRDRADAPAFNPRATLGADQGRTG